MTKPRRKPSTPATFGAGVVTETWRDTNDLRPGEKRQRVRDDLWALAEADVLDIWQYDAAQRLRALYEASRGHSGQISFMPQVDSWPDPSRSVLQHIEAIQRFQAAVAHIPRDCLATVIMVACEARPLRSVYGAGRAVDRARNELRRGLDAVA